MSGNSSPAEPSGDVCPKRFGLNYDPPSIVVEYLHLSTGKLFHRRIGLRRLRQSSDPARVAEKLRQRNQALLAEEKVSFDQIVTLVTKLQESLGLPASTQLKPAVAVASGAGGGGDSQAKPTETAPAAVPLAGAAAGTTEIGSSVKNGQDDPVEDDENLNKLSTEELAVHKAKMDVTFFKNQKKPTDTDFIYDVQVDFPETEMPSGWDSEDDVDGSDG